MKKYFLLLLSALILSAGAFVVLNADNNPAPQGKYTGSLVCGADGKNRQVIIVNSETGDFEVFDIDNKGFDRKENVEYYDCISYNRKTRTRIIYKYLIPGK